jgi:hypothetical protein
MSVAPAPPTDQAELRRSGTNSHPQHDTAPLVSLCGNLQPDVPDYLKTETRRLASWIETNFEPSL